MNHLEHRRILFQHKMRRVTSVVKDHVGLPVFSCDALVDAPPKIFLRFSSPCEYRIVGVSQCRRDLILGRVNVARSPAHLSTQLDKGFDEDRCLRVDVGATYYLGIFQRLKIQAVRFLSVSDFEEAFLPCRRRRVSAAP